MNVKNDAIYIKTKLIDFFLEKEDGCIIGSEVMYGVEKKIADLVLIKGQKITAYEIKSKYDTLDKLSTQLIEYCKVFNYVYVVVDEVFEKKIQTIIIPENVGLIVMRGHLIHLCKKAFLQKNLVKQEMIQTIKIDYIKMYDSQIRGDADTIRTILCRKSLKKIEMLFYAFLCHKITPRFNVFMEQRGQFTHLEDVFLLSYPNNILC